MPHYAIGDIHGQLALLKAAHARIARDAGDGPVTIVHLGDLVDRGPDASGVLEYLIAGPPPGQTWITLCGNHDRMMRLFLADPQERDPARPDLHWLNPPLGGRHTLASYGVDVSEGRSIAQIHAEARRAVPAHHRAFLADLPLWHRWQGHLFVHAGLRPGLPLERQSENDLVWIRGEFLDSPADHGALVIHGHTPVDRVTHHGNRVSMDTGAAYGGPLSAAGFAPEGAWVVTETGRAPLSPPSRGAPG